MNAVKFYTHVNTGQQSGPKLVASGTTILMPLKKHAAYKFKKVHACLNKYVCVFI